MAGALTSAALVQLFDWQSEDNKCRITFDVTRMLCDIAIGKLPYESVTSLMDDNFARKWVLQRDIHPRRVATFTQAELDTPVLGVWMKDATVLLIDGSHRYAARWIKHLPLITWHLVALADWQPYATITGELQ
jgi:hypothetical protein